MFLGYTECTLPPTTPYYGKVRQLQWVSYGLVRNVLSDSIVSKIDGTSVISL